MLKVIRLLSLENVVFSRHMYFDKYHFGGYNFIVKVASAIILKIVIRNCFEII